MEPLVSVIVPVYNVLPYLREALDSLIHQTYTHLEILLIDDGSTDGSGEICDEYAAKYPDLIRIFHQENRGLSGARNTGLDNMTGDFVAFLDPDDAFHPEMIHKTLAALQQSHADIAICKFTNYRTNHRMEYTKGNQIKSSGEQETLSSREALQRLAKGQISQTVWDKLYSRSLWANLRFPEGKVYEDRSTTYQILSKAARVVTLPVILVLHRKRRGSITYTRSLKNFQDYMTASEEFESFVRENVPNIFNDQLLLGHQEAHLRSLIIGWSRIPASNRHNSDNIRRNIIRKGEHLSEKKCQLRTRIAYQMFRFCPELIPLLLPIYRPFRILVKKVTGR